MSACRFSSTIFTYTNAIHNDGYRYLNSLLHCRQTKVLNKFFKKSLIYEELFPWICQVNKKDWFAGQKARSIKVELIQFDMAFKLHYVFFGSIPDEVSSLSKCFNWICAYFSFILIRLQTEIAKRLSALINQLLPCLQPEHQQSVLQAVERAKQVTMPELNAIIGVSVM